MGKYINNEKTGIGKKGIIKEVKETGDERNAEGKKTEKLQQTGERDRRKYK